MSRLSELEKRRSRRRFLRGLGTCVALPAFESLLTPLGARAAELLAAGSPSAAAPVRLAFVTFPNGAHQGNWWPTGSERDFTLGPTMQPLAVLKDKLQIIAGLDHQNATPGSDGAGDHARASATLLTGARAKKTAGADIHVGKSIDQLAAEHIGQLTRYPSLELTCDDVRRSGKCDSGYSCAYQFNVAWKSETTPLPPEPNPRLVFERLFGGGPPEERARNYHLRQDSQRSVLDFVRGEARSLHRQIGPRDQRKLDEYLTSVRDIETRIQREEQFGDVPDPGVDTPPGIPSAFEEHMRLMYDMLLLAFKTDSTRVATLILAHDGNNRAYPDLGIPEGHHYLSHHQNDATKLDKVARIDAHYMKYFAEFLTKMRATEEEDGTSLLDNSAIVYCCGNADGNRHTHENLPVILAGSARGRLDPGRYLNVPSQPMSNLFLDLLEPIGVDGVTQFGDSDGRRVLA
jgi:hypothetical protein